MTEDEINRWFLSLPGKRKEQIYTWLSKHEPHKPLPNQIALFKEERWKTNQ